MAGTAQKPHPLAAVAGIGGAVGGWALAKYSGASLLVPGVTATLLLFLFTKTSVRPRYFRGAISISAAHIIWFTVAAILLGTWTPIVLDVAVLAVGVVWLWLRPGLPPVIFMAVVELISLALTVVMINATEVGTVAHRALVVHILLRALVIACLVAGFRRMVAEQNVAPVLSS